MEEIELTTDMIDALMEAITAILGDGWQAHLAQPVDDERTLH